MTGSLKRVFTVREQIGFALDQCFHNTIHKTIKYCDISMCHAFRLTILLYVFFIAF